VNRNQKRSYDSSRREESPPKWFSRFFGRHLLAFKREKQNQDSQ
jgi:hypothetical protein